MYTKYTYSYYSMYPYCIRFTKSVDSISKNCINGENCTRLLPCNEGVYFEEHDLYKNKILQNTASATTKVILHVQV